MNQIICRRILSQLGAPSAQFSLSCRDWNSQFRGISRIPAPAYVRVSDPEQVVRLEHTLVLHKAGGVLLLGEL
jgi:hypothetical protein